MKITDLVGRLAPKYPGLCTQYGVNFDGWRIGTSQTETVYVSNRDLEGLSDDDLVAQVDEKLGGIDA